MDRNPKDLSIVDQDMKSQIATVIDDSNKKVVLNREIKQNDLKSKVNNSSVENSVLT